MGSERKRSQVCFWDFVLSSWKGGSSLTKMGRPRMGQEWGSGEENAPSESVMFEVSTSHPGGKASLEVRGEIQAGATTLRAIHREIDPYCTQILIGMRSRHGLSVLFYCLSDSCIIILLLKL